MTGKLALIGILTTAAVAGNAQQFNWLRDANGRNMEFVQQGGAASKYSFFDGSSYGKVWVDSSAWSIQVGGLLEAVLSIKPGTQTPPLPSQRSYMIHTALTNLDAKWNTLAQQVSLGAVLYEEHLTWQTIEGYDQFLVRWNVPELIDHKWISLVEDQPNTVQLGTSRVVQGTSAQFPTDIYTTSVTQGSAVDFPDVNVSIANPVPEPATIAAFGIGLAALLRRRRRPATSELRRPEATQ